MRSYSDQRAFLPYKILLLCDTCRFNITAHTKPKKLATGAAAEYVLYTCTKKSKQVDRKEPQASGKGIGAKIKDLLMEYELSEQDAAECMK